MYVKHLVLFWYLQYVPQTMRESLCFLTMFFGQYEVIRVWLDSVNDNDLKGINYQQGGTYTRPWQPSLTEKHSLPHIF